MIATHSLSITRYSPAPQSLPFINATTKVCYFPLILFIYLFYFNFSSLLMYKIYDCWPSRNLLEGCPKRDYWVYESLSKLLKKDGTFQSNIIGLLFKYCCSKGLSTYAADTVNFQGMIYNLLVNLSNICKNFIITKSVLLPTIMYNILSFKIVNIHH